MNWHNKSFCREKLYWKAEDCSLQVGGNSWRPLLHEQSLHLYFNKIMMMIAAVWGCMHAHRANMQIAVAGSGRGGWWECSPNQAPVCTVQMKHKAEILIALKSISFFNDKRHICTFQIDITHWHIQDKKMLILHSYMNMQIKHFMKNISRPHFIIRVNSGGGYHVQYALEKEGDILFSSFCLTLLTSRSKCAQPCLGKRQNSPSNEQRTTCLHPGKRWCRNTGSSEN